MKSTLAYGGLKKKTGFIVPSIRRYTTENSSPADADRPCRRRREFRDYFVTHLPSSSLHPDPRGPLAPFHKLPRSASVPHTGETSHSPAAFQALTSRDTTVVRIPLRSAKHHFGASTGRGTRPSNEDTHQAGVIDLPAFAKRPPASLTIRRRASAKEGEGSLPPEIQNRAADSASGDPQVFYFGVFDGHGGVECSQFLKENLHEYIQNTAAEFELRSTLRTKEEDPLSSSKEDTGAQPIVQGGNGQLIGELEKSLVHNWRTLVGGYFRRFSPAHFSYYGRNNVPEKVDGEDGVTIEEVMEYAFLHADYDFVSAQAAKRDDELDRVGKPVQQDEILHDRDHPSKEIAGDTRFKGGSTASVALISTPSPAPFWYPTTSSSLLISHVGDTRVLLCSTETGEAIPVTTNHHPSSPIESNRLRRYATTSVTDSFGEERVSGLANTRAFGDVHSKRVGVSAEPEMHRVEMAPAEFSFLVLMTDGISGTLQDQEIVDIVKEARTPEEASRDVVSFATEVTKVGDNATCLVVRLGGWERRLEGGLGSMRTKESRQWRRQDATDPRRSRT